MGGPVGLMPAAAGIYRRFTHDRAGSARVRLSGRGSGTGTNEQKPEESIVMKTNDLTNMLAVALATASLTVILFSAGPLNAGGEAEKPAAENPQPRLVVHGVELTLAAPQGVPGGAGQSVNLELTASNTNDAEAGVCVDMQMTVAAPENPMSRVVRLPSTLWQRREMLVLKPRETRVVMVPVGAVLPPNSMIAVTLREGNPAEPGVVPAKPVLAGVPQGGVVALRFATGNFAVQTVAAPQSVAALQAAAR